MPRVPAPGQPPPRCPPPPPRHRPRPHTPHLSHRPPPPPQPPPRNPPPPPPRPSSHLQTTPPPPPALPRGALWVRAPPPRGGRGPTAVAIGVRVAAMREGASKNTSVRLSLVSALNARASSPALRGRKPSNAN